MKTLIEHIIPIMLIVSVAGCGKIDGGHSGRKVVPAASPVSSIEVKCGNKLVESYTFTYDKDGRLSSLLRRDENSGKVFLNLAYSYDGTSGMTVKGTMDGKPGLRTLIVSHSSSEVSYVTDSWNSWRYTTSVGRDDVARGTYSNSSFSSNGGFFSSKTDFSEVYELVGKDIVMVESGTEIAGRTVKDIFGAGAKLKPVSVKTASSLVTKYTYSDASDRQNFCSFIFNCNFPVWYAEGLPGCEHLITDVNMATSGVDIPQHQHFDYTFNDTGDIVKVTRTWSTEGKNYLTLTYDFKYNDISE